MKKLLFIALAVVGLPLASQAQMYNEVEGYYAGINSGVNFNHLGLGKHARIDTDAGYLVSGSIGVKTCYDYRIEGEISYRSNSIDRVKVRFGSLKESHHMGGRITSLAFMANGIYDIPVCYSVKPYVGAGIGYARNHKTSHMYFDREKVKGKNTHKNGFAWQAIAGVAYSLADCGYDTVDLTLDYRYFSPNIKRCWDNSVVLGLRTSL